MVAEFWIVAVNTFVVLYEMEFKSVYSNTDGKVKLTQQEAQRRVKAFYEVFPGMVPFIITSLFEGGEWGAY